MTVAPGTRLGPYEITARLGSGGMGEVWRATDTQLRREVAVKVLPAAFTASKERLARFKREAQLLAQLQHPNIASVFGLEDSDGVRGLVMELVDGDDLSALIARGPLPLDEALAIARQVAEALEAAHEKGIVHRDLKPDNIKLTAGGKVKVLDFGVAKATAVPGSPFMDPDATLPPSPMGPPSQTPFPGTQLGMVLGTAAYMAPEQARGLPADRRADIWSFGVVFWEMLAGRRLFTGDSRSDLLTAVLTQEVAWSALPAATPPAVRWLLRRCLERNLKNRLHDIADARIVLDEVAAGGGGEIAAPVAATVPARSLATRALPWLAGAAFGALCVAMADRTFLAWTPATPPTLVPLTYSGKETGPSASPDGKTVAFTSTRDGRSRIWLKQLSTGEEVAITSGPNDASPSFSPDGNSLLFLRGAAQPYGIYRVSTVGGEPRHVTDGIAVTWSPDGRHIAVTRSSVPNGLPDIVVTMPAEGGEERELARTSDIVLFNLRWSPDGGAIGAWAQPRNFAAQQSIIELDAVTGARRTIYPTGSGTVLNSWAWNGPEAILLSESVNRSERGGTWLRRVERRTGVARALLSLRQRSLGLDVAGTGRVVIDQVAATQNLAEWPLGPGGTRSGGGEPLRWLTRGASVDRQPVFSPDGRRLLFNSDRSGNLDLWELTLASGALRPLTVTAADDWDPVYTPDGQQILWGSNRSGNYEIWIAASDGSGARKLTGDGVDAENPTATPDGKTVVYATLNPTHRGIWKIRSDGSGAKRLAAGTLGMPELSPNGRWVSYADLARNRLCVVALADGRPIAEIELPSILFTNLPLQLGRSRWLPSTSTLVWLDYDAQSSSMRLVAQEIVPGRDTRASRRTLVQGTPDDTPESFAVSPDGRSLLVSVLQPRSELLLIDGLPGVSR
ncbi:MAG TPA: protein kinase [Thermoanaerobaculia bacterium]|jgi:Tol biopolymer transport system component|nr:protein kinase [Thermoanaerobaculia bacterium]